MEIIKNLLWTDIGAVYIIGLTTVFIALWQFKRKFKLSQQAKVFEELTKDITAAQKLLNNITNDVNVYVSNLAIAANNHIKNSTEGNISPEQIQEELKNIGEAQNNIVNTYISSYIALLEIIKKIEKNTLINTKSKKAARQLFYISEEQYQLVDKAIQVLKTIVVTPPTGDPPNVSHQTFNTFVQLLEFINIKNNDLTNYLSDLEVILHNSLVRKLFGRAKYETIPFKHLKSKGLTDKRVNDSLL